MVASACPLSLHTSVAAHPASTAPPADKTLTSAARTLGCAVMAARATMRLALIAVPAAPPTLVPTASCPTCPAAPHPARTEAPAALRGTPPTSVPACQVGSISIRWPLTHVCACSAVEPEGCREGIHTLWRVPRKKLGEGQQPWNGSCGVRAGQDRDTRSQVTLLSAPHIYVRPHWSISVWAIC